jgi:hypothetical protein
MVSELNQMTWNAQKGILMIELTGVAIESEISQKYISIITKMKMKD